MTQRTSIGTFYQGQTISVVISSDADATESEKAMLKDNDLYVGVYGEKLPDKKIFSSADGSIIKQTDDATGITSLAFVLSASTTKRMNGPYIVEMLIKNGDNSFTSPSENVLTFSVEPRRISQEVIR